MEIRAEPKPVRLRTSMAARMMRKAKREIMEIGKSDSRFIIIVLLLVSLLVVTAIARMVIERSSVLRLRIVNESC